MLIRQSLKSYLNQLASESPAPGGGSASAVVASLGISLILMVARVAVKKVNLKEKKRVQKAISDLKKVMNREFSNVAKGFFIPVDFKVGQPGASWGDLISKGTE